MRRPAHARPLHPSGVVGATLLALLVLATLLAPWLSPRAPSEIDLRRRLEPPSWSEPFGTDELGRSTLARVVHGGRVSLLAAALVALSAAVVGAALGGAAVALGGRWEGLVMRVVDGLLVVPPLLLALAIVAVLGPGLAQAAIALVIAEAPTFARLTRSELVVARERPFVEAAVAAGARPWRVVLRHLLPAAAGTLIVQVTLVTGFTVVALSGVSFLGLGVQPPTADWGDMLARARGQLPGAPWLALAPGVAVSAAVLGCNLLGDALRDALGPPSAGGTTSHRRSAWRILRAHGRSPHRRVGAIGSAAAAPTRTSNPRDRA